MVTSSEITLLSTGSSADIDWIETAINATKIMLNNGIVNPFM